jgi:hypothetical protein
MLDAVLQHRFHRHLALTGYMVRSPEVGNSLAGANIRYDSERQTLVGKVSTDGHVLGVSATHAFSMLLLIVFLSLISDGDLYVHECDRS